MSAAVDRLASIGLARAAAAIAIFQFLIVAVVAVMAVSIGPIEASTGRWSELSRLGGDPLDQLIAPLQRWDGLWYQHIVRTGYSNDGSTAFFPLFPALGALASRITAGNVALGLTAIACAAYGVALWLLGKLAVHEVERRAAADGFEAAELARPSGTSAEARSASTADRVAIVTMLSLATFPTAFFFVAPFTESLFLALALGSFLLARRGQIGLAGLVATCAALVRFQGIFLALPILWEAVRPRASVGGPPGNHGGAPPWWLAHRRIVLGVGAAAGPILAVFGWYALLTELFGPAAVGLSAQSPWGQQIVYPWDAILSSVQYLAGTLPRPPGLIEALNLACLLGFAGLAIGGRRQPASFAIYEVPSLILISARAMFFMPLMSVARYVLVLFPGFVAVGAALERHPGRLLAWLAIGALAQMGLVEWFARWGFVA